MCGLFKKKASQLTLSERRLSVEREGELSICLQQDLLCLSSSSFYYQSAIDSAREVYLMNRIHEIWSEHPFYGYRKVHALLNREGICINHKKVQRLMQKLNLRAITCTRKTSLPDKRHLIYPYLLKGLDICRPNMVWQTDITYIPMRRGFAYLVAFIDVFSRYCVGYAISISLETEMCLKGLESALCIAIPLIINTDQGSQFTSSAWIEFLKARGIQISMDGVGRCLDNVYIERLWRSFKYEELFLNPPDSMQELKESVSKYILFYVVMWDGKTPSPLGEYFSMI